MQFQKEDYIKYRAAKSKTTLLEVEVLLDNQFWNTAISRMYYACFYIVGALLVKNNIKAQSHSGCIQQFGKYFVVNGIVDKQSARIYFELFEKRQKGDYNDLFDFDMETATGLHLPTIGFVEKIELLLAKDNLAKSGS